MPSNVHLSPNLRLLHQSENNLHFHVATITTLIPKTHFHFKLTLNQLLTLKLPETSRQNVLTVIQHRLKLWLLSLNVSLLQLTHSAAANFTAHAKRVTFLDQLDSFSEVDESGSVWGSLFSSSAGRTTQLYSRTSQMSRVEKPTEWFTSERIKHLSRLLQIMYFVVYHDY